jgi:3-oxoadipate enol-lactonase
MPLAKVGDINLYYEIHGSGEPLVLIMGYGFRAGHWFAILDKLAAGNRVVVFDNRGTGRSDKPNIPYTAKMMAGDVAGLLDEIGISVTSIFGVSKGGMIAQEFALSYPGRLKNLVLGATSCGGTHAAPMPPETIAFLFDPERAKLTEEEKARDIIPWLWNKGFVDNNPEAIKRFIATTVEYPTPAQTLTCQGNALITFDSFDRLKGIKAPTLVISGTQDRIIPSGNSKLLAGEIPGAELAMIANAGHGFITDSTAEACKIILDFLQKHS